MTTHPSQYPFENYLFSVIYLYNMKKKKKKLKVRLFEINLKQKKCETHKYYKK